MSYTGDQPRVFLLNLETGQRETVGDKSRGVGRADQPVAQHQATPERERPGRQGLARAHRW